MSQRLAVLLILALAPAALGGEFSLTIGSPVAGQDFRAKNAAFVVRTEACAEPAKAQVSGVAEGIVNGARRSAEAPRSAGAGSLRGATTVALGGRLGG